MIKLKLTLIGILFSCDILLAQNENWYNFTDGNYITSTVEYGNLIWVGTSGGLVRINKITGETIFYNGSNSDLPHNFIKAIDIDANGILWIGTWFNGLASLDGNSWEIYPEIPLEDVSYLAIDIDGSVWFASGHYNELGLFRYDGTSWANFNSSNSGLPFNGIFSLTIDDIGTKWIGTYGGGLAKFDNTNWTVYNKNNSGLPDNYVKSIAVDNGGTLWIAYSGTQGGIAEFNGTDWTIHNHNNSGCPNTVYHVAVDTEGTKWLSGFFNISFPTYGLVKFNGTSWTYYTATDSGLPDNDINSIMSGLDGTIWIGTKEGLANFDGVEWTAPVTSNSGLPTSYITSIAVDSNDNKWAGAEGGLAYFDGSSWSTWKSSYYNDSPQYYESLSFDSQGTLWLTISYLGYGLSDFASFNGTGFTYHPSPYPPYTPDYLKVMNDQSDNLWCLFNLSTKKLGVYHQDHWGSIYESTNTGIDFDYVQDFSFDMLNNLWLTCLSGLAVFDGNSWTVHDILPFYACPYRVEIDNDNIIWASWYDGLIKYGDSVCEFYNTSNSGLPSNNISVIAFDQNNTTWIGTMDAGLVSFDGNEWKTYNTSNSGLPDNRIIAIEIDAENTKWIACYWSGLVAFNENGPPLAISKNPLPEQEILLYPNPADDMIIIEGQFDSGITFIEIYNMQGSLVVKQKLVTQKNTILVNTFIPGVYLAHIITSKGDAINKFIKK